MLILRGRPEESAEGAPFSFTFKLPAETNLERLHVTFMDGRLTVEGPLLRNNGRRRLDIEQPHLPEPVARAS